ncbi:glycosyltransferase family 2 protein [Halobaculum sp. D14]|uniref:glycosyltransferase family 2 protein n=1 Tax=unclassified Halobaculum TaxID=2640896 RepID=UPI003EB7760A
MDTESESAAASEGESGLTPEWWWDFSTARLREAVPTPDRDRFPGPVSWDTEYAFSTERIVAALIIAAFTVAVLSVFGYLARVPFRGHLLTYVYVSLWGFVAVYVVPTGIWAYEAYCGRQADPAPLEHDADAVQVRILTVSAESVVQNTVDALPERLDDRHVVAEEPMDVDGAEVHVVPDEFDCEATRKGRALEWARRAVPCDREYVLFLDEDTLVTEFDGLPDADIVQFREWPMYTGSYLTYWAEVLRMGYQTEQRGFEKLGVPLYVWGGGVAIRRSVEDEVTWNYDTLIEDTVFAWHAARRGASLEVMETKFRNQAPPSVRAMLAQRRRWFVGTLREEQYLTRWYRALDTLRNVSWAFSPVTPFLLLFSRAVPEGLPGRFAFHLLAQALFVFSLVWVWRGWRYYDGPALRTLPVFLLYPFVTAAHSAGAAWGLVSPPETFETTEKSEETEQ